MATKTARKSLPKHHIPVGPATCTQHALVKIDWTDAPVVRVQMRTAVTMLLHIVSIVHSVGTLLQIVPAPFVAGQVIYFVRCDAMPGHYYVVQWSSTHGTWSCSCPEHHGCEHADAINAFAVRRAEAEQSRRREAALAEARAASAETLAKIEAETLATIAAEQAAPEQPKSEQARIAVADFPHSATAASHCNDIAAIAQRQINALADQAKRSTLPSKSAWKHQPSNEIATRLEAAGLMRR